MKLYCMRSKRVGEIFDFHQKIIGFEVNTFGQSLINTLYNII